MTAVFFSLLNEFRHAVIYYSRIEINHNDVSAAIGRVWQQDEIASFVLLFKEADAHMYDNRQKMHLASAS